MRASTVASSYIECATARCFVAKVCAPGRGINRRPATHPESGARFAPKQARGPREPREGPLEDRRGALPWQGPPQAFLYTRYIVNTLKRARFTGPFCPQLIVAPPKSPQCFRLPRNRPFFLFTHGENPARLFFTSLRQNKGAKCIIYRAQNEKVCAAT